MGICIKSELVISLKFKVEKRDIQNLNLKALKN